MRSVDKLDDSPIVNAFKHMQVPLMIVGASGRILDCNQAADRLFGYAAGHLKGRPAFEVLSVASVAELNAFIKPPATDAIIKGMAGRAANGKAMLLGVQLTAWEDAKHGLQHALVLRDIAEEAQAERVTQGELRRANNAIIGAGIAIFEYDPLEDIVTVSDRWRELLEIDAKANSADLRRAWYSRLHPDDLNAALNSIKLCLDDVHERTSSEYRLRSKDDTRWIWIRSDLAIAERDETGKVIRVSGAMSDITKGKTIEVALRKSEEKFRSAFDSATIGKAIMSLEGDFLQVNRALCDLTGYSEQELLSTNTQTLTHSDDLIDIGPRLEALRTDGGAAFQYEKRFIRANGAVMWGLVSVDSVKDVNGRPQKFVAQLVDVTEQRRLNELKSEFISIVNHELRTPLTSILGSLMLLASLEDEPFSDEAQRLIYIAQKNGERLHTLINDVLDFEKFSANKMRFKLVKHRIITLVEESILVNLASADEFGVKFDVVCPDRTVTGLTDGKRFEQIMANLLSNAAKFATADSTIRVAVEELETAVRIAITNDGKGIPESFRDNLFQPFMQADPASTRARGGTGLGLAITKQIVEQTGGEIGFDNTVEGRTTFWFTVPRQEPYP